MINDLLGVIFRWTYYVLYYIIRIMAKVKPYFFTSKHYSLKPRKFNEIHPCRIYHERFYEHGWYLNSHMRRSKLRGFRLANISFGLISGYRSYRIPYISIHTKTGFIAPTFLLGSHSPYLIVCTYGDPSITGSFRQIWRKLREKGKGKSKKSSKKEKNDGK